jgi:hypothetical protein
MFLTSKVPVLSFWFIVIALKTFAVLDLKEKFCLCFEIDIYLGLQN